MPPSKRGRACDACHSIKIKCELGASGGNPPCQRCTRLGKDCAVSISISQKDRIAELEARLEAMTKLLESQNIRSSTESEEEQSPTDSGISSPRPVVVGRTGLTSKKRRLERMSSREEVEPLEVDENGLDAFDKVIPRELQMRVLSKFHAELATVFPISVPKDYFDLRERLPYTLQSIVFAACPGLIPLEIQNEVTSVVMRLFTPPAVTKCKKSTDLVQAIVIAALWYRQPKDNIQVAMPVLNRLAADIGNELGLSRVYDLNSRESPISGQDFTLGGAWRTWVLVDCLSSSIAVSIRLPHQIRWDADYEAKLCLLEYGTMGFSTDPLLGQFLRAERLCEQITSQAGLVNETDTVLKVGNQIKIQQLQNLITDWQAQIPSKLSCRWLDFYEFSAHINLHEYILHTPANKRSFAGPYVAERLSMTDFPTPIITQEHITSAYQLRDMCHSLLDLFMSFDVTTVLALPATIFSVRALYAQWILIKLYIVVTGTGNTFGAFIDPQSLQLEQYLDKMGNLGERVHAVDESSGSAKILNSPPRLKEWILKYKALQFDQKVLSMSTFPALEASRTENLAFDYSNVDWAGFAPNDALGFGFDDLFGATV